ncbi:hypothetical protein ABTK52_19400, partial [Acinetobacter baumannii]
VAEHSGLTDEAPKTVKTHCDEHGDDGVTAFSKDLRVGKIEEERKALFPSELRELTIWHGHRDAVIIVVEASHLLRGK